MKVGDIVLLKRPVLGNEINSYGFVYEEYEDFDDPTKTGVSVIFPNGNYDGFSFKEQQIFFTEFDYAPHLSNYKFENVIKLSDDYRRGKFDSVFGAKYE